MPAAPVGYFMEAVPSFQYWIAFRKREEFPLYSFIHGTHEGALLISLSTSVVISGEAWLASLLLDFNCILIAYYYKWPSAKFWVARGTQHFRIRAVGSLLYILCPRKTLKVEDKWYFGVENHELVLYSLHRPVRMVSHLFWCVSVLYLAIQCVNYIYFI